MELEDLNLESLSIKQLRELITLVSRQTTLKSYRHECGTQVKCTSCDKWFCYACYNLHLVEIHGSRVAQFNEKINTGSFFLPEKKEVKPKKETKVKVKVYNAQKFETPWGTFTLKQIAQILKEYGD